MALLDKDGNPIDEGTPEVTPEPEAPKPVYITADEYKVHQALITDTLGSIKESLQALHNNNPRAAEAPEPEVPDATDDEIEEALRTGTGAKQFRKMVNKAKADLEKVMGARASRIESLAGGSIAGIAKSIAQSKMTHYNKPYIKKDVDMLLAQMPAEQRLTPENHLIVYNAVVGQHFDQIVADEAEAKARAAKNTAGVLPGGSNGRGTEAPADPTVENVFGEESARELARRGRDLDSLARGMGFKDGKEYLAYAKQNEGEGNVH